MFCCIYKSKRMITILRIALLMICASCSSCINSYSDYSIDYILTNINTDSSIIYLGQKVSTDQCKNSCINLNYLCDFSIDNVFDLEGETSNWQTDSQTCTITISGSSETSSQTGLAITSDLVSEEYIIDAQLTVTTGSEGGVLWKSNINPNRDDYCGYFFCVKGSNAITGVNPPGTWAYLREAKPSFSIQQNTKYNLSVHVIGTQFTTYINGEQHFSDEIDETIYPSSYAAIYSYYTDVTFHSFRMRYVSAVEDEMLCAAYLYDKSNGDCYGYYGNDYTQIESSLSPDAQQQYDSAVLYDPSSCVPTNGPSNMPSNDPSTHPSNDPSKHPSNHPSTHPSNDPNKQPSNHPSNDPTAHPTDPSDIPTQYRHQSEGRVLESTKNYQSTSNVAVTKDGARMNPMVVVLIILIAVVLVLVFCIFLWFYLLKTSKTMVKNQNNIDLSNSIEDPALNETAAPQNGALKGQAVMGENDGEPSTEVVGVADEGMHGAQKDEDNQNIVNVNGGTKGYTNDGICDDEFVVVGDDEMNDTTGAW
eukprot:926517_1